MKNTKLYLNSIVVGVVVYFYAAIYWIGGVSSYTNEQYLKPWVYRVLVPILVNGLDNFVRHDLALVSIVVLSGVTFYLSLRNLVLYINDTVSELKILVSFLLGLVLFSYCRAPYDMMTGFLWTLGLLFIVQQKHIAFMVLFPFVCLNRIETAPLLIVAYWLRFPWKWQEVVGCGVVFATIYLGLHTYFADNLGSSVWIEPWQNVLRFWYNPWRTLLHLFVTVVIVLRILIRTGYQPFYFQRLFIVLAPIFLILYLVVGQSFEVRVFTEIYPILVVLTIL